MSRLSATILIVAGFALAAATTLASPPVAADDSQLASVEAPTDNASQTSDDVAQDMIMTRLERWGGSFNGCLQGATEEERAMAVSLEYTCACLATYIVNLCAPTDGTTNEQVMMCVSTNEQAMQNAFTRCLTYGSLYFVQ